ncbi:conserved hypothetical protein [Verticillium alfalfae VaMs.102]|uniref:Luciferase domain-containing protein n=1 Tax=Verticillium alfalfae (strain VaMs.102 / ATCC MYA-4576 / FGSC 10136) TaxID=526221 RepID=C9S6S6_VERA1|nr:conserved hypothetical protein [Verticillium alfalfae VaMs.102]EEY15179.1 conserved hypothetical protein [Verticillium alfalfae VaMs.102]
MNSSADSQRQLIIGGAGAVAALLLSLGTTWAVIDYNAYIALGPGGPPNNFFGWVIVNIAVRPFCSSAARAIFTDDYPKNGAHKDIESLPRRRGPRASVAGLVPHRQVTQRAPETMRTRTSSYERHHDALFVAQNLFKESTMDLPKAAFIAKGELGHHHEDLSMHLYLSPADARQVIEKGWGERHRLSVPTNTWFRHRYGIGDTYLMIYGPRDEEEMEALRIILESSIRFMTGRDVNVFEWKS